MKKIDFNSIIYRGLNTGVTLSAIIALMDISGILRDIGQYANTHPADLEFLDDNGFIKRNDGIIQITNDGRKILASRRDFSTLAAQLRGLYPAGMKDGKWPWRSTPSEIKVRLETFEKMYPDISDEEIILATKQYLLTFNEDKGRSLLIYFIYKDNEGHRRSILAEYVHAHRDAPGVLETTPPAPKYNQI